MKLPERFRRARKGAPASEAPAPQRDGEAVPSQLVAANGLLADERAREESFNTRGIALGAAALIQAGLLGSTIADAVTEAKGCDAPFLDALGGIYGLATVAVLAVVVFGVLRPSSRSGLADSEITHWTSDEGMLEGEAGAQYTLLVAAGKTILSRREANAKKATNLDAAYLAFATVIATAITILLILAIQ